MNGIRSRFTKWYVNKGFGFGYDFTGCEIIGNGRFKTPLGLPNAYFTCPWWVKPLLILFSPSTYMAQKYGTMIAQAFKEGIAEREKMADVDRCAICGQPIPEGVQVCTVCRASLLITPKRTPTILEVRFAAKIIKDFCDSQNEDPEKDCIECPIKDICYNEPYLWEV